MYYFALTIENYKRLVMRLEKKVLLLTSLLLALGLNACDSNKENNDNQISNDKPVVIADSSDNKEVESVEEKTVEASNNYKEIDFNAYSEKVWLKYFVLANTSQELSDEELVSFIHPEYASEMDAFKKKDMVKELLPEIKNEMKKYKNVVYLAKFPLMPIEIQDFIDEQTKNNEGLAVVSVPTLLPYDVDHNGFPIGCFQSIMDLSNQDINPFSELITPNPIMVDCKTDGTVKDSEKVDMFNGKAQNYIVVKDEGTARKIEEAARSNLIGYRGDAYFRIEMIGSNLIATAIPVEMNITYVNKNTKEELLSKKYTFSIDE